MESKDKIFKQVLIALFGAIIIIQNFIPFLGYIPMGPLNLTIIHITVIVTALVFGTGLLRSALLAARTALALALGISSTAMCAATFMCV